MSIKKAKLMFRLSFYFNRLYADYLPQTVQPVVQSVVPSKAPL